MGRWGRRLGGGWGRCWRGESRDLGGEGGVVLEKATRVWLDRGVSGLLGRGGGDGKGMDGGDERYTYLPDSFSLLIHEGQCMYGTTHHTNKELIPRNNT